MEALVLSAVLLGTGSVFVAGDICDDPVFPASSSVARSYTAEGLTSKTISTSLIPVHTTNITIKLSSLEYLQDYVLSEFKNLALLDLTKNRIHSICPKAFDGLTHLFEITLEANSLATFPDLSVFPNSIEKLDLDSNGITVVEESKLSILENLLILTLNRNDLEELPPINTTHYFPKLKWFSAQKNLLHGDLTGEELVHMPKRIIVEENSIDSISDTTGFFITTEVLVASDNELVDNGLTSESFAGFHTLEQLGFEYNRLTLIPDLSYVSSTLKKLFLRGNKIAKIHRGSFADMATLEELDLGENLLSYVPDFSRAGFPLENSLEVIHLDSNMIQSISVPVMYEILPNLRDINIADNRVETFDMFYFYQFSLQSLNISKAGITKLPMMDSSAKTLKTLDLSKNEFEEVDPSSFLNYIKHIPSLKYLYLVEIGLESIPDLPSALPDLKKVEVGGNNMTCYPEWLLAQQWGKTNGILPMCVDAVTTIKTLEMETETYAYDVKWTKSDGKETERSEATKTATYGLTIEPEIVTTETGDQYGTSTFTSEQCASTSSQCSEEGNKLDHPHFEEITMSSTMNGKLGQLAADGDHSTCSETGFESNRFWKGRFHYPVTINTVFITGYFGTKSGRVKILVGNETEALGFRRGHKDNPSCSSFQYAGGVQRFENQRFDCKIPLKGYFLIVMIATDNPHQLKLCEVDWE